MLERGAELDPEIPIAKKNYQQGVAKMALFAYDRASGQVVASFPAPGVTAAQAMAGATQSRTRGSNGKGMR